MRNFLLTLAISVTPFMTSATASACSCEEWGGATAMLKNAEVAFLGVPSKTSIATGRDRDMGQEMRTEFTVIRNFKGAGSKAITLYTDHDNGGNCGQEFEKDDGLYVIFAYKSASGKLETSGCDVGGYDLEDAKMTQLIRQMAELTKAKGSKR